MPYADYQVHLAKNRERQKTPRGAANHAKANKAYRQGKRQHYAAHIALNNAVRDGKVIPWPACAVPECNDKPEAHHPDYSEPLSVVWLCSCHHKQTHALARMRDSRAQERLDNSSHGVAE